MNYEVLGGVLLILAACVGVGYLMLRYLDEPSKGKLEDGWTVEEAHDSENMYGLHLADHLTGALTENIEIERFNHYLRGKYHAGKGESFDPLLEHVKSMNEDLFVDTTSNPRTLDINIKTVSVGDSDE